MKNRLIVSKLVTALGTVFLIITINFFLVSLIPGDPLANILGDEDYYYLKNIRPELIPQIEAKYGLNESLFQRYLKFLKNTVTLNFGYSYVKNQQVADLIFYRLRWTLALAFPATLLSAVAGGLLGIKAGWHLGSRFDQITTALAMLINTIPDNCLSILMLVFFSYKLKLLPISGMSSGGLSGLAKTWDILRHMVLPVSVMVISRSCSNFIHMKSYVAQVKEEDYILTAVSKGLANKRVLNRHVLRNCLLPYLTLLCIQFGHIVSGSVMVETVFSWLGMGTLLRSAVITRDLPMLQLCFLLTSVCMVGANLFADLLYIVIDPRVKEGT